MRQLFIFLITALTLFSEQSKAQSPLQLSYGTFLGGIGSDLIIANSLKTDVEGARYGYYGRPKYSGMPLTSNAFQDTSDSRNGYLAIFNDNNILEFGSYIGGTSLEHNEGSFTFSPDGGVIVVGATWSEDFPIYGQNPIQAEHGGLFDIFILKLDSNYDVLWSTFFGGDEDDIPRDVICDEDGNIYVAGSSFSLGLGTAGVYQTEKNETEDPFNDDAILLKLSPEGKLLWCTYFGGNSYDKFSALSIHPESGSIYCVGETRSSEGLEDMIWQPEFGGGTNDGLFGVFNAEQGTLEWASYIGGNGAEQIYDLVMDEESGVFLALSANSDDFAASENTHQQFPAGQMDALIMNFSFNGELNWSTYYGGSGSEGAGSISYRAGHLLISGLTNSSDGIFFNEAIEEENSESNPASFLAEFDLNGQILFGSYFLTELGSGQIYFSKYFGESEIVCLGMTAEYDYSDYMFSNALQQEYGGGASDFILFVFNENPLAFYDRDDSDFILFPNPANDFVRLKNLNADKVTLKILDLQGKLLLQKSLTSIDQIVKLDLLPRGMYFVYLIDDKGITTTQKLIVQ